jgi:NitT/TauT family transport system substrate-binding protein
MDSRRFLAVLILAMVLPASLPAQRTKPTSVPAETLEPFVFSPQWTAQAQFAGYYVAKEMGFYEEEGLDVEIVHPFSTQTAMDRLRSNAAQATTLTLSEAIEITDSGLPLVNILQTSMNTAMVIVSRYGSDPLTLHRAKVIKWRAGYGQVALCMASREKLDYQWITAASCVNLFVAGAVDAALAMSYNEYYQLLQTGLVNPDGNGIYRFADHGYNIQEDGLYMTAKEYRKDPDRAERFARASRRGWEWAAEHQEETLEIVMNYIRDLRIPTNRTLQKLMLQEVLRLQIDADSGEREFRLRPDMVGKASSLMLEEGILKHEVKYEQLVP